MQKKELKMVHQKEHCLALEMVILLVPWKVLMKALHLVVVMGQWKELQKELKKV